MAEKTNFVTIELSKKQVDAKNLTHNEKTDKDYARIFAPGGGVLFYPVESIKIKKDNPERVYFSRPEGTELQVYYSNRRENVPENAPASEKYENYTKTFKIEDLKAMYDEERKIYAENNGFVNMTVPTTWGKFFSGADQELVSISIPIPDGTKDVYYSFVLGADRFKESEKEAGMSYFGFPKKHKDDGEDYMVHLKTSVKQEDGSYEDKYKEISSVQLKEYVEQAKERSHVKDLFVSVKISSKLVRNFSSRDGKDLAAISVPVYENEESEKAVFYEIVVPEERIKSTTNENFTTLSLFKNGPDGTAYNFNSKRSVLNENGDYEDVSLKMTSEEVINYFKTSQQRFKEKHQDEGSRSLADELEENQNSPENNVNAAETTPTRRHSGR